MLIIKGLAYDFSKPALPTAADIADAARLLDGIAVRTPLLAAPLLARGGARVFLKCETLQHTGSFKFRGAYNCIARIPAERRAGGVVAYSSGNHAQGVAAAAKLLGLPAVIVMPRDAPLLKRERTAAHGAEVVLYDRDTEDRAEIAGHIARERNATLVPPFDHPHVIAGQGTAGMEICEQLAELSLTPDMVLVPASGGGLLAGISLAVKDRFPSARMVAVEPAGFDDHARSFASGRRERNARLSGSICDALLTATPGELTFPITNKLVTEAISVSDDEVRAAMAFAFRELKLVVEPGGAVALAAWLARKIEADGKTVVLVLSGGNADPEIFRAAIAG
jgi:threonine dehydratase